MKTKKAYFYIAFVGILTSCSGPVVHTSIPDRASVDAKIYQQQCGSCHSVPHPKRLSYGAWINLIPEMEKRMVERGRDRLNEQNKKHILSYLKLHAR